MNFFGEKHGKSSRDQHFSVLSTFLRNAQITKQLTSTNDVIEALEYEQAKSNENRVKLKLDPIQSLFLGTTIIFFKYIYLQLKVSVYLPKNLIFEQFLGFSK